ncbi:glycoside hydrolase family 99-like domain-containing protein [Stenotrophomonas sp.]|uniref:glycoside hydrolase family 99-like domain-containing protein n=1 Tax=Stenotrophomonas sp. TaxID=69392 RepID=UPI002FC94470
MSTLKARLRQAVFVALRAGFRALPLSDGQRDRLRARFLRDHGNWVPPPPRGRLDAAAGAGHRPRVRADEAAIGYVAHRQAALPAALPATLVAFYLPQFHPFAENDAWWGKGFTEWRNVTRALPQFEGHIQPRLPADLGFYDLRNPQVMRDQAQLASEYGIGAFCFYYYWFSGTTLMETPLRQWLADDRIQMPFCLCWANENWARRWDGRDEDILIGQQHSAEDDLAFIAHVADYLRDRRALKVDGKPMLLVYRPHLLPDARATATRWRQWCRDNGIGEIHLAYVQGFERPDPREIGFDAAVEFPPNMSNPRSLTAGQYLLNPDFEGDVRDWRELAAEIAARPLPPYTLYPGVNPGWDNEARRSGRGRVYLHASPRGYGDWLSTTIHQRLAAVPTDQRLVFINAWNEWAEGAVLEPDARLGHAYLEATRNALHVPVVASPPLRACAVIQSSQVQPLAAVLDALDHAPHIQQVLVVTPTAAATRLAAVVAAAGASERIELVASDAAPWVTFLQIADRLLRQGDTCVLRLQLDVQPVNPAALSNAVSTQVLDAFNGDAQLGLWAVDAGKAIATAPATDQRARARLGMPVRTSPGPRQASPLHYWVRLAALRTVLDAHFLPSELQDSSREAARPFADALESMVAEMIVHAGFHCANDSAPQGDDPGR